MKTKILEGCGGAKADDKVVAEARWEDLKMQDFGSVADFDVHYFAAAKKCEALEERQFSQYEKLMSASLKKSMNRFKVQQEKQIMEQKAMAREMRDAV